MDLFFIIQNSKTVGEKEHAYRSGQLAVWWAAERAMKN
jgi:hypothetical protein